MIENIFSNNLIKGNEILFYGFIIIILIIIIVTIYIGIKENKKWD